MFFLLHVWHVSDMHQKLQMCVPRPRVAALFQMWKILHLTSIGSVLFALLLPLSIILQVLHAYCVWHSTVHAYLVQQYCMFTGNCFVTQGMSFVLLDVILENMLFGILNIFLSFPQRFLRITIKRHKSVLFSCISSQQVINVCLYVYRDSKNGKCFRSFGCGWFTSQGNICSLMWYAWHTNTDVPLETHMLILLAYEFIC